MINKLKSRKLWLTILGAIAVTLNKELGLNIPPEIQGKLLIALVLGYVIIEGLKDIVERFTDIKWIKELKKRSKG